MNITTTTTNGTHHQAGLSPIRLSFVDFVPETASYSLKSLFTKNEVKYSDLIDNVNNWLLKNVHWEAVKLETYVYDPLTNFGKESATASQPANAKLNFGIRLWIVPRANQKKPIQKMKVLDMIPKMKIAGFEHGQFLENVKESSQKFSSLYSPEFETTNELIERLNKTLTENEYIGQIVNIETLALPVNASNWTIDGEAVAFAENFKGVLNILRVHLNERLFPYETVEMHDFVPNTETWNSPLAVPNVETFSSVLRRASTTLKERSDNFRIVSLSTLHCPTRSESSLIDLDQTYYSHQQWFNSNAFVGKFLRVILAKPIKPTADEAAPMHAKSINCKVFIPNKKEQKLQNDYKMASLKEAIHQALHNSDVEIVSAETEMIHNSTASASLSTLIDTCLHLRRSPSDAKLVFKIYVNDNGNKEHS